MNLLLKSRKVTAKTAIFFGMAVIGFIIVAISSFDSPAQKHNTDYYPVTIKTAARDSAGDSARNSAGDYTIQAELADTPDKLAMGLMGRTELKPDHGMLFLFPEERDAIFWMKNTLIHLDLVYIGKDGIINHIHPMAKPHDETPLPAKGGKVIAVLEIAGGQAAEQNIKIGDKVTSPLLDGFSK